jgi:hypothetical protein
VNEREKRLAETEALRAQGEQAAHEAQQKADAESFSDPRLRASLGRFSLPAR